MVGGSSQGLQQPILAQSMPSEGAIHHIRLTRSSKFSAAGSIRPLSHGPPSNVPSFVSVKFEVDHSTIVDR
jgi:hypothetical protein